MKLLMSVLCLSSIVACGTAPRSSDIKVTNGQVISEDQHPEVIMTSFKTERGSSASCTATFINDHVALTAAHCVNSGTVDSNGQVQMEVSYVTRDASNQRLVVAKSVAVYQDLQWQASGGGVNPNDLGLVVFPAGTAKAHATISTKAPAVGDKLTIVGYGLNNVGLTESGAGVKRQGNNTVKAVEKGFIKFEGVPTTTDATGTNSASGSGDSGGPLFIDGKLVGVTSGGSVNGVVKVSNYVDLTSAASKAFLALHSKR